MAGVPLDVNHGLLSPVVAAVFGLRWNDRKAVQLPPVQIRLLKKGFPDYYFC